MASTTQTPQQTLEDRKVAGMLDDMFDDCLDADKAAKKISSGAVYRAMSSASRRGFDDPWDALLSATDASETERDYVLKGKARDLRKFKGLVQTQLDALTSLEDMVGRMQVLEDAALAAVVTSLLGSYALIAGSSSELRRLQVELATIKKKLEAASRVARDTKVKAAVGAALGAATIAMGPVSIPTAVLVFAGGLAVDGALSAVLAGREDTNIKTAWTYASNVAGAADALDKMPAGFGPMMSLVKTTVDISECFAAEGDKNALLQQMDAFMKDFEKARAKFRADADKVKKAADDAKRKMDAAMSAVASFRPSQGSFGAVLRYL